MKINKNKVLSVLKTILKRIVIPFVAVVLVALIVNWFDGSAILFANKLKLATIFVIAYNFGYWDAQDDITDKDTSF